MTAELEMPYSSQGIQQMARKISEWNFCNEIRHPLNITD